MSDLFRIAVDVGNSSVKLAFCEREPSDESALRLARFSLKQSQLSRELENLASTFPDGARCQWLLASVNQPGRNIIADWIAEARPADQTCDITHNEIPLRLDVRFPDRVGIDRVLAAWGAWQMLEAQPAIIVDAGTTITVDLVTADETSSKDNANQSCEVLQGEDTIRGGVFRGGAIMPGLGLQLRCLHEATDKLPMLSVPESLDALSLPGRDTEAAIFAGVTSGVIGGICSMIDRYRAVFDPAIVLLTGGDAQRIFDAMNAQKVSDLRIVDDLPLRGLYRLDVS